MRKFNLNLTLKSNLCVDDQIVLFVQAYKDDFITSLTDELSVGTFGAGDEIAVTLGPLPFVGVTPGSKAIWDAAKIRVRAYYIQENANDEAYLSIGNMYFGGTYWPTLESEVAVGAASVEAPGITVTGMRATLESTETCSIDPIERTCKLRKEDTDEELLRMVGKGMTRFTTEGDGSS